MSDAIVPWQASTPTVIPPGAIEPSLIVRDYALGLKETDRKALVAAFESGNFGMAAGHLWRRSMSRLRTRLASLGMQFLGEMLNRKDITEASSPDAALTDHDVIFLAEALGFVDATGAMRLRQGFEIVSHFDSERATEEMSILEAGGVVRSCVQYVFRSEESSTALNFTNFRNRVLSESLRADDDSFLQILDSPLFFIRTALRTLLAAAKQEEGARLEHALANLNAFLPGMWTKITDDDRWSVGTVFAELSNVGTTPQAITGVRKALLRVKGFDFVPESLRSNSFRRAAQAVLSAHFGFNNFYTEPEPTKHLAMIGTSIPIPALAECLRAYLCVFLGNRYGVSYAAASTALAELKKVSADRWQTYFSKTFIGEEQVLYKLTDVSEVARWVLLADELPLSKLKLPLGPVERLIEATVRKSKAEVKQHADAILTQFKGVSR